MTGFSLHCLGVIWMYLLVSQLMVFENSYLPIATLLGYPVWSAAIVSTKYTPCSLFFNYLLYLMIISEPTSWYTCLNGCLWYQYPMLECWFESRLFHFESNFWLICLGRQQKTWAPATHVGYQGWILVSRLWPNPDLSVVAIWGVKQKVRNCVCVCLSISEIL